MSTSDGAPHRGFRFSIDRGGTFTDVFAELPDGSVRVTKLLSVDPDNYADAPREGIRRVLEAVTGIPHPKDAPLDTTRVLSIRMGTTVATNALLEREGERTALVVSRGFRDLLHIGNQARPRIFDLQIRCPDVLYDEVVEIDERVRLVRGEAEGDPARDDDVRGVTDELVRVVQPLDMSAARAALAGLRARGIDSVAVLLLHSYTFPDHERQLGSLARELGFSQVSLSCETTQMVKAVPRGFTTCADAYLSPVLRRYIASFRAGFDGMSGVQLTFMQSDGGLTDVDRFSGHKAILSGPAGGVVGYATTTFSERDRQPVVGFDMGGTSTDVSRYGGRYEHVYESTTAGVTILAPQLDINTVAAGGGSRLFFRDGLFVVGPQSAGAHPGPVCYRKGGHLAVTDANVLLGRVQPQHFPCIFGPNEDQPLDVEGVRAAFGTLKETAGDAAAAYSLEELALGFITVANEAMCRPIRNLTQMRGFDITTHILSCFGGAGGQHACAIAKALGINTVFVHRYSGVLSAYGLSRADLVAEAQEPIKKVYRRVVTADTSGGDRQSKDEGEGLTRNKGADTSRELNAALDTLARRASAQLQAQGFSAAQIECERFLNLRYDGTDCAVMTACPSDEDYGAAFVAQYKREFGFTLPDRDIIVDDLRVRAVGKSDVLLRQTLPVATGESVDAPPALETARVYFDSGWCMTKVHDLEQLLAGHRVLGPAIVIQGEATVVVEPGCVAVVTEYGDLRIDVGEAGNESNAEAGGDCATPTTQSTAAAVDRTALDPIRLSIFSHRFMGIAEQMGRTLQRTSISVNIKERLDFSCALFGPDGGLVANAPHLPVHLGAMQEAVRYQIRHWSTRGGLISGDVLVSNHPQLAGGSHLPDITVITPVFAEGSAPGAAGAEPLFFVASRGHHADIGGIAPGSMPPLSKCIADEGAAIVAFKLVDGRSGQFQEAGITDLLMAPGKIEGNSGTRNLKDNLSDLRAQVAANTRGVALVQELIEANGLDVVVAYMRHIQANCEHAVRLMLKRFARTHSKQVGAMGERHSEGGEIPEKVVVHALDRIDDGTPIELQVTVDGAEGTAHFDFTGTGAQILGNLNAPPAVTYSAIIYCLRCLLSDEDIPLNQGCLAPITVHIPENTLLNPGPDAAVVGGNVLTSQRVTDVVLQAFRACASSQGCMNNLTFGDDSFGYYETIAGGAGAGPTWHGRSGVHTHMTNTRITDPEILERRCPVLLRQFGLREGSGGTGAFRGGDGVVRELEFTRPLTVSILSERRAFAPPGMSGGGEAQRGINLLVRKNGDVCSVGGKNTFMAAAGDRLRVLTPGGGGFGAPVESAVDELGAAMASKAQRRTVPVRTSGSLNQYRLDQESA